MTQIVKSGWIQRHSKSFLEGGWKSVWVVLHQDSNLEFYKRQGDSDPKGSIFLKEVSKWFAVGQYTNGLPERPDIPSSGRLEHLLAIPVKPSSKAKIIWFLFQNDKELNDWMSAIVSVLPPAPRKSAGAPPTSTAPYPAQMPYAGPSAPPSYAPGAPSAPPPYTHQVANPPPYAQQVYPQQGATYTQQAPYPQQPYPQHQAYPRQPYPQQPYPQQPYPQQQPYYPQQQPPRGFPSRRHTYDYYEPNYGHSHRQPEYAHSRVPPSYGMPQPQYQQRSAYAGVPPPPPGYPAYQGQYPQQPYYGAQGPTTTVVVKEKSSGSGLGGVGEIALGMAGGALLAHGATSMMGMGMGGWGGGWGCGRWGSWSSLSSMSSFGSCGSFGSFGSWD